MQRTHGAQSSDSVSLLNISEVFYSVQGEGKLVGTPSVFIRTSGCNLRCAWCDTPYTSWQPEKNLMTVKQIMEQVRTYPESNAVVLTGGEPMIQDIRELVDTLKEENFHITIETNGTVYRELPVDLISLSPKLSNSLPQGKWRVQHNTNRIQLSVLAEYVSHVKDYQLKFVVNAKEDLSEIQQLIGDVEQLLNSKIPPANIVLMPQGKTYPEIKAKYQMLVDICLTNSYRLSPRLHVDIWGDKRGV